MTPGGQLQAAFEALGEVDQSKVPARHTVNIYFRKRRYIGSKDRRIISNLIFEVIRNQLRIDWHIRMVGEEPSARLRTLLSCLINGKTQAEMELLCDNSLYSPASLTKTEQNILFNYLCTYKNGNAQEPDWVKGNYPSWLEPELHRSWGNSLLSEMVALDAPAPTDIRVNKARTDRPAVLQSLVKQGFNAIPTPHALSGIRLIGRPAITQTKEYRNGCIELQDEGAQLVAILVDAEPSHYVIDFCAGAGGKALAIAATLNRHGRIVACDIDAARLKNLEPRIKRAGTQNIETHILTQNDHWFESKKETADRVLVDVPCSGTGTWRREPDARTRLTPTHLQNYIARQQLILEQAQKLVKPGGQLIYSTCSMLTAENKDQIDCFLTTHTNFVVNPIGSIWLNKIGKVNVPATNMLQLSPHRHATDGFFVAVLTKRS